MLLTITLLSALLASGPVYAAPGGHPGGPPAGHGANPNGTHPVGAPVIKGDTDRGRSEGKGRNDLHGAHVLGRVASVSGNMVTVRMSNGTTQTFTLTPAQVAEIRSGEHVVFFTNGATNVTRIAPADVSFRGVVTSVVPNSASHKSTVTVRLPNGKLRTITVANEAAENMRLREGKPVIVTTTTGFLTQPTVTVVKQKP
jgi:molybdopterin-binding protein